MAGEKKLWHCAEDDPLRCQGPGKDGNGGQCGFLSLAGMVREGHISPDDPDYEFAKLAKNCPKHGGMSTVIAAKKKKLHDYMLHTWKQRVDEFAESESAKSLRGEIGITRLMIENLINQCRDEKELAMFSSKISDLVVKCEKLVKSAERLENTSGMVLDRSGVLRFGARVADIIAKYVDDQDILAKISNEMIDALKGSSDV